MANIPAIQFKRSETPGALPDPNDMKVGELALNIADKKILVKDSDGQLQSLGFYSKRDKIDVQLELNDSDIVTETKTPQSELTLICDVSTDNNWQDNPTIKQAKSPAKINLLRRLEANVFWDAQTEIVRPGGDGMGATNVMSSAGVVSLNYSGQAAYAFCRSFYNDTYRLQRAYVENGDHASLGILNNYFVCQIFANTVSIGNGTILGQFENGRTEYFRDYCVEFYDGNGDLITSQTWTGATSTVTNNINVAGNIDNVKSIIMRGDNGNNNNPGFNDINFYVNGSTAFPATGWTTDQKWSGVWANIGNTYNQNPVNELFIIQHVSTTSTVNAGGMYNYARNDVNLDMALTNNNDPYYYYNWLHKPFAIAGGSWSNGRERFPEHFLNSDIQYHDGNNNLLYRYTDTHTERLNEPFHSHRGVSRILMIMSGRSGNYPAINSWDPGFVIPTDISYGSAFADYESYAKLNDVGAVKYGDGALGALEPFQQLTQVT